MKYNVGDKVMLLEHLTRANAPNPNNIGFMNNMEELKGRTLTIRSLRADACYVMECPDGYAYDFLWLRPAFAGSLKEAREQKQIPDEQYLDYLMRGLG